MKVDLTIISHYITRSFSSWMVGRICIMSLGLKGLTCSPYKAIPLHMYHTHKSCSCPPWHASDYYSNCTWSILKVISFWRAAIALLAAWSWDTCFSFVASNSVSRAVHFPSNSCILLSSSLLTSLLSFWRLEASASSLAFCPCSFSKAIFRLKRKKMNNRMLVQLTN